MTAESTPETSSAALLDELRPEIGVTAPRGFRAAGLHCGIRKRRADLALVVSDRPASAAAVFTTNKVQAAPLTVCREHLARSGGWARAVVVNAGNANACNGPEGFTAARSTAAAAARLLGVGPEQVLVTSTGVIGQRLPVERILEALPQGVAELSVDGAVDAAEAILTTDTRRKETARRVATADGVFTIGGMAKGSGMIHPNMATTLAFVTTDAAVEPALLQRCLRRATDLSFNRLTVDGDTSTNDMITVFANGAAGVTIAAADAELFTAALTDVLVDLARAVAGDGEGASRLLTIEVTGAASEDDALAVARTIAGSLLVKTAVHGADANWGRIVAAAGRAGVDVEAERMRIWFGDYPILAPGFVADYSEKEASERLRGAEVVLRLDLGLGDAAATTWTCDLSADYVRINASYRT